MSAKKFLWLFVVPGLIILTIVLCTSIGSGGPDDSKPVSGTSTAEFVFDACELFIEDNGGPDFNDALRYPNGKISRGDNNTWAVEIDYMNGVTYGCIIAVDANGDARLLDLDTY